MLVELRQFVNFALPVNTTVQLDKLLKLIVKMIVVLDLTSLPINLRVLFVKRENGKIKLASRAAKHVVQVHLTKQLEKVMKLIVKVALVLQMQINPIVFKKICILNVPVDHVPRVVEVLLEQRKTVKKVQVYLGGMIRQ